MCDRGPVEPYREYKQLIVGAYGAHFHFCPDKARLLHRHRISTGSASPPCSLPARLSFVSTLEVWAVWALLELLSILQLYLRWQIVKVLNRRYVKMYLWNLTNVLSSQIGFQR